MATGLGSLEGSRGTAHLTDPTTGEPLAGEVDVQGHPLGRPGVGRDGRHRLHLERRPLARGAAHDRCALPPLGRQGAAVRQRLVSRV